MPTPRKTAVDPVFAAYAKTAPREDLRWTLTHATRTLAQYDLPARAVGVIGEMRHLLPQLAGRDGTPADRTRVQALVQRYKSAIPDWSGDPWKYGRPLQRLVRRAVARGVSPAAIDRLRAWYVAQLPTDDPFGRVLPRLAALTPDEVEAALTAVLPTPAPAAILTPARRRIVAPRPAQAVPAPVSSPACPTPGCRGRLTTVPDVERRVRCTGCAGAWTLLPVGFFNRTPTPNPLPATAVPVTPRSRRTRAPQAAPTSGRPAVDWRAAGLKAAETRRRNLAAKAAALAAGQAVAA